MKDTICIENIAFYELIEKVFDGIREKSLLKNDKWITTDEAMDLLRIKSKTTLQKLRDDGKIRASQPNTRMVLYDQDSITDFLEDFAYETFDLP